jgi:SpoIID/LytB domain
MSRQKLFIAVCIFFLLAIPMVVPVLSENILNNAKNDPSKILVFNMNANRLEEMDLEEYVEGVVAKDFAEGSSMESLKAQAVIARTFAMSQMKAFGGSGCQCNKHEDYHDICSGEHCQGWLSKEEQIKEWGAKYYQQYLNTIAFAVNSTKGEAITFEGDIIHNTKYGDSVFTFGENNSELSKTKLNFDELASNGFTYKDIINYYFPETKITKH